MRIIARYLESTSFTVAIFLSGRKIKTYYVLPCYIVLIGFLAVCVFYWDIIPACFVKETGFTLFSVINGYIIYLIFSGSLILLLQKQREFDKTLLRLLAGSILFAMGSELVFTFHTHLSNLIGHYLKIIFFYIMYRAIVEIGLRQPYSLLFRGLRQSEEAFRESETKLRSIFDSSPNAITVTDMDGVISDCNQMTLELHGYSSKDEVIGKKGFELIAERDHERVKENSRKTLKHGFVKNIEYTLLARNGEEFPAEFFASLITDCSGEPAGFVGITRDITERKQWEWEIMTMWTQLEYLLASSPAVIMKRNGGLTEQQAKAVETIHCSGERLLMMINDTLDLSKIEAGKLDLKRADFHLPAFLKGIADIIEIKARQKGIHFKYEVASDVPEGVYGDEKYLSQILLNLLGNAVKYTEKGDVDLIISQQADNTIRFTVKDTGIGIPNEKIRELFLPFHQLHDRRYQTEGTGLGLAISQRLVHMMGDELHVDSAEGVGTTFWFEIDAPGVMWKSDADQASEIQKPIIPPSKEEIQKLFNLAMKGDVFHLSKKAKELKESNPELIPFGNKICMLAKELMVDELQEFISEYM
ncbi:MAG: PAS domain S-box protein [Desulfobacteraceae bacterium]|nr:PAS domain S-box protein [Desulfobacteraceae bacterium]